MASNSQRSRDYLRAIETLSENEENMRTVTRGAGPGGEGYDRVPNPPAPQPQSAPSRAGAFFKHYGAVMAAIAAGAFAVWAGRKYWK